MEEPREEDWLHRPTLSARYSELKDWFSKDRLRVAWNLGQEALASASSYPSQDLAFEIGVERKTVYEWMSGKHKPSRFSLVHLDAAFTAVLGEDWTQQVDRELN